jgi:hypothetical protein
MKKKTEAQKQATADLFMLMVKMLEDTPPREVGLQLVAAGASVLEHHFGRERMVQHLKIYAAEHEPAKRQQH